MKHFSTFEKFLKPFPTSVHANLQTIPQNGGMLTGESCRAVIKALDLSTEELMVRLLPLAALYSRTPISDFRVGAVAKARILDNDRVPAFFLGANIEFAGQALNQTIHAEQAAIANAWLQGAGMVDAVAVTAAPCGHCRQFLNELDGGPDTIIILPDSGPCEVQKYRLADLLPRAFGPSELGPHKGMMASEYQPQMLSLRLAPDDPMVHHALKAAENAYAPYSRNLAGCAIQINDGRVYAGRYAENAAFNPGLSPLHTAIIRVNMDHMESDYKIKKAVLVEKPTSISQHAVCKLLLHSVAPGIELEYFEAI